MKILPEFSNILTNWYKENKRDLPWRRTKDPYKIWVSEIILQQTRVAQGIGYYNRFIEAFPDIKSLAQAPVDEVLRLWQGLGYYSRARNLHFAANEILNKYNCELPSLYKDLLHIKGIGTYTAAAISSFCFDEKVGVLDGNVYRVLSRIYGVSSDILSGSGKKEFYEICQKNLPQDNCSEYNQAIMEFGALQCVPKSPNCAECVMSHICYAFKHNLQSSLPVKIKKSKSTNRYFTYFILKYNNGIYFQKRENKGIWEGLYEFYLYEGTQDEEVEVVLKQDDLFRYLTENNIIQSVRSKQEQLKHVLSHQNLFINFVEVELKGEMKNYDQLNWFCGQEINELPKPVVIHNYLKKHIF